MPAPDAPRSPADPSTEEPIGLRHPVVLVHGLLGFFRQAVSRLLSYAYFQGVEEDLAAAGVRVATVALPPTSSVEVRARALAEAVERLGAPRVNLVAHSLGGLDARWWVGRRGGERRVASIVTVGTPHRGTYVATWGAERVGRALSGWRLLGEAGVDTGAFRDLTREACAARNDLLARGPQVPLFSFGGARPWWAVAAPLQLSFRMLQREEGPNDGLVSVESSRYGDYLGTLEADHLAETGWHWTPPGVARFDHVGFYRAVARDLAARGF